MIRRRMSRLVKIALLSVALSACAALVAACGTQKISTPGATANAHYGAVLFAQRCSGCHTLSYAGTHGSASNVRTAMQNNGPNFNVRCERPISRILYAIENGGFSGAIMPQNIVVGADARAVAQFVSQYAGRQSPKIVGQIPCGQQQIGTLPAPGQTTTTSSSSSSSQVAVPGTQLKAGPHSATAQGTHKTKPKK
jgi:mono/diheme cytochrome c family protein